MHKFFFLLIACGLFVVNPRPALAGNIVVGVNTPGVANMTDQQQDALIDQLQKNRVKVVRTGIGNRYNRFIIEAHQRGIGAVVVVYWPCCGITHADPVALRASVTAQLAPIEAAGVPLTAFELGNEINGPFFNGDFLPGLATGRVLGLSDLDNPQDREGQAIAASYRAYLSLLAVLKDVRDHSKVNRKTPIITAGMGDGGLPGKRQGKLDGVSIPATFAFLRRNGIDKLVDGYGVHVYPSGDLHRSTSTRTEDLQQDAFALCTAAKPCWLTEWGWGNPDQSCPLNDKTRAQLIQLERKAFEPFVKQGRLAAMLFYMWSSLPGAKSEDPAAIFRCGTLTDAGKLALSPMGTHKIISQATGLCFNINGNTNDSGEAIIPYPCGSSTNMEFNFVDQGSGFYSIHTVNGTQDLCLNISTAALSPGDGKKYGGQGNLIQWSCGSGSSPSDNELFKLVDLGGGRQQIHVKNSGLCLEDPGSGGTIRQNVCSSSPNQTFTLTPRQE